MCIVLILTKTPFLFMNKSILHNHNVDMYALWVLVYHKGTAPYLLTSMINVDINDQC